MSTVHVVVPEGIDDPARPSGGNTYDRQVCRGLAETGWSVRRHEAPGRWPRADRAARAELAGALRGIPDGVVVLVDGLVASSAAEVLAPEGRRLRLVVVMHMPLGQGPPGQCPLEVRADERAVLHGAVAVVATSRWTRRWLLDHYRLESRRVHVAEPGVQAAALVPGTPTGHRLLCVGAVTPTKGHDLLVAALAGVSDLAWRCVCAGSLDRDPEFADRVLCEVGTAGVAERVRFTGALPPALLDAEYAGADALVLASRAETYGMVVTEALARGVPVIATRVGGVPQALGRAADGRPPGLLVPPGDAVAVAAALRRWLTDATCRESLRRAARERRERLPDWSRTTATICRIVTAAAA